HPFLAGLVRATIDRSRVEISVGHPKEACSSDGNFVACLNILRSDCDSIRCLLNHFDENKSDPAIIATIYARGLLDSHESRLGYAPGASTGGFLKCHSEALKSLVGHFETLF